MNDHDTNANFFFLRGKDGFLKGNYQNCIKALVEDSDRNTLIVELATKAASDGHTVLVLSSRVQHCRLLAALINEQKIEAEVLVGATPKAGRQAIIDGFRAGRVSVVVASTLADEGLDVPRLDRIILAYPSRAKGRTAQRLGRLMRPHPEKKKSILYDVVDPSIGVLLGQYRRRQRLYAGIIK